MRQQRRQTFKRYEAFPFYADAIRSLAALVEGGTLHQQLEEDAMAALA